MEYDQIMKKIVLSYLLLPLILMFSLQLHARDLPNFVDLAEKYGPSVVNISTTQKIEKHSPQLNIPDLPEDSPFNDFFRRFFGEEDGVPRDFDARSLGSGFIVSNDGYILTNNHVVRDADTIIVRLNDRREFEAEVVGTDERSDMALLKVDATGLPEVKIGKSTDLKVGEWVLAIGSPFGFDHSVTAGIVSAKGRSLPSENYVPFIQTDVAINPGNSGGPLFNMDGEVVGINSQIYSRTGGFMGLSFAIPIEVAMDVVDQLKTKGHVVRGWLGVLIQDVTRELAESFGMKRPRGALVSSVLPDSPAAKAGFKVGDVIIEFNGEKIERSGELPPIVGRTRVGSTAPVKVLRDGKNKTLQVTIGELPTEEELASATPGSTTVTENRLSVEVRDLTAEQKKQFNIDKGVYVQSVKKGPARSAGISRGDIILRINNIEISDVKQFRKVIDDLPANKSIPVLVQRRGGPIFLAMKISGD
jgi:serine protease Do